MGLRRILCLFVLCVAVNVLPAHASTISLNVASPVQLGQTFDVVVQGSNLFPAIGSLLFGYGFNVSYDPIFQYAGSTAGTLFDDFSGFPGSPAVVGFVKLAPPYFGALGPLDVAEPLTLAILHFTTAAPGTGSIRVRGDASNPNEGLIYLDLGTPNGAINASTEVTAAVPEPHTLILLIAGIPVLLLLGDRKRML